MINYKICNSCIMDTSDEKIFFDKQGICNHCNNLKKKIKFIKENFNEEKLLSLINIIKKENKSKKYDCLIGVSGGFDSTYICYLAKKYNLRPLLVHLDNGWNSELAVQNIENILKKTNFDYINHIIDWDEFKEIQISFLKASVIDLELPTDVAIFNLLPKIALKYKIKYILSGSNVHTEGIMGAGWNYNKKKDQSNVVSIKNKFSKVKLISYPIITEYENFLINKKLKIKEIKFFDYLDLDFINMKKKIIDEFNWTEYNHKHGESFITSFYQRYILPKKFNIDKRRAHISSLICSNQISRDEGLKEISKSLYENKIDEENDLNFFLNKFDLSKSEFEKIMKLPINSHESFNENISFSDNLQKVKIFIISIFLRIKNKIINL